MQQTGFPLEDVKARFETIDHANVSKLGFSKERFPRSMRDTYSALCTEYARPFDKETDDFVQKIGSAVFQASPRILDGVTTVLSKLQANNVRLILATKGDREVQEKRVQISGLRSYFDSVHILSDKGLKEFVRLIQTESVPIQNGWSVGNSARSDINPALAAGLNAIWIPRETWVHEEAEVAVSSRLHVAKSILEVPVIILQKS